MPTSKQETSKEGFGRNFPGDISTDVFLRDYWQKKPLLIRNAFPKIKSPLTPDELAGLACEEGVNARIVIENNGNQSWAVKHGPFNDTTFSQLPEKNWTLLVSHVEQYLASAKQIIEHFRFIPDWRIDDLMISYAPDGGSVGPHLDSYDVFLLQIYGRRNWKISAQSNNTFLENTDLSILSNFNAETEWTLQAGDMLYLPPGVAHHGVAEDACMTCSIGFRAPSVRDMVNEFDETLASSITSDLLYTDPGLREQAHPAEITPSALHAIEKTLSGYISTNEIDINRWFGEYITDTGGYVQPLNSTENVKNYQMLETLLVSHLIIAHEPGARFLFVSNGDTAILFVEGNSYAVSLIFAKKMSLYYEISTRELLTSITHDKDKQVLIELYNNRYLYFPDDAD